MNGNNIKYFDSFGNEYIPTEIKKFIGNKNITKNIYEIAAQDSTRCEYFCTVFIDFMFKGKRLTDFSLFSPNNFKDNDKIILNYLLN